MSSKMKYIFIQKKFLCELDQNSLRPELLQIGNGLENVFLWDEGFLCEDYSINNETWRTFISLLNPAIRAVRDICGYNQNIIISIDNIENK